jgi:dipeptidyl aminopeptidase/acylaminoacyl peptidase
LQHRLGEDYEEAKSRLFDREGLMGVYQKQTGNTSNFALVYEKPALIPREVLFGNPDIASVTISPDGYKIAYLAARNGVMNVFVADAITPHQGEAITHDTKRGIQQYHWAFDNAHILYLQDNNGDENWHVLAVNVDTLQVRDLTPFKGAMSTIAKLSERIPDKFVVATNNRDPKYFDLHEVDIKSGRLTLLHENKEQLTEHVVSDDRQQYKLRYATKVKPDGSQTIFKMGEMVEFLDVPLEDVRSTKILGLGNNSDVVYALNSIGRNTNALIEYTPNGSRVIHHDPTSDIDGVMISPGRKNVQVVYNNYLKKSFVVLDQAVAEDMQLLTGFGEVVVASRDLSDKLWIVAFISDRKPLEYYLYDRKAHQLQFLFTSRQRLAEYRLSPMWPTVIKSRDGLDLVSYLTIPVDVLPREGFIPRKPVPLILYVHGGPKGIRDTWGLDNTHQWLANRGYAVLSVNYSASGGFGKHFMNAGDGQWAKKMHEDLLDAVKWATDLRITDTVAIYGASYGGYATLVGLTLTPDVFACGIDVVGPSNLVTMMKSIPSYWAPFYTSLIKTIGGDPDTEEGRMYLESISPLNFVKNIRKPLLIAQGAHDPRVKQAESDQIVNAMKDNHIPVTYLLYADEGHGFVRPENKLSFYAVAEHFLAENLGGKSEPIGDAFKGSSVVIIES